MAQGNALPGYVEQEFEGYFESGRLEHGFLRVRCDTCHTEHLVVFSCKRRGFSRTTAQAGAVTLIQRFGGALNLNVRYELKTPYRDGTTHAPFGRTACVQIHSR